MTTLARRAADLAANLALLARRRRELDDTLASLLVPGTRVALLNFPNHQNVGDSLLWLGARRSLERIGVDVAYECAFDTFSARAMRRRIGTGPILLNGGGNLGDAYAGQQGLREHVLATCHDHEIVQLPQSTWFRDPANADRVGRLIADHGRVTLLLRDHASVEVARRHLRAADTRFCPDTAFGNEPLVRPEPATTDVVWLTQHDLERHHQVPTGARDVPVLDWVVSQAGEAPWPPGARIPHEVNARLRRAATGEGPLAVWAADLGWRALAATFEPLARAWVDRGVAMASLGRVAVTDRAHGHVLSLLLGIPSVVLDNVNHKVAGIVEASTADSPLTHPAADAREALDLARALARDQAADPPVGATADQVAG